MRRRGEGGSKVIPRGVRTGSEMRDSEAWVEICVVGVIGGGEGEVVSTYDAKFAKSTSLGQFITVNSRSM